jgi:hypothetical protein
MDWATIGSILGGMAAILTLFFSWMNSRFNEIHNDTMEAHKRIDASNIAMNARIDLTQSIIMRMLERQGK